MAQATIRRAIIGLVASVMLLGVATTGALAHEPAASADDADQVGSHDVTIDDVTIRVSDVDLDGPGLPEKSIDEATYTVDGETTIDGFTVTVNGQEYAVGHVHVVVEDVGVTFEDVSVSDSGS